jgi:hypothetical protein
LAGDGTESKGFSPRITPAEKADRRDEDEAAFNKELAAVEPVDGITLQRGVGEKAMKEKSGGCEIDAEMEGLPQVAAQSKTQVGSYDNECEKVERYGANGVFERLAGRVDRVEKVHEAKARVFVEKKDGRMQKRDGKSDVARPIVEPEIVEPMMRPGAMRAIPKRHEHPEKEVHSDCTYSDEADISGKVENADAHWHRELNIGFETARNPITFHGIQS